MIWIGVLHEVKQMSRYTHFLMTRTRPTRVWSRGGRVLEIAPSKPQRLSEQFLRFLSFSPIFFCVERTIFSDLEPWFFMKLKNKKLLVLSEFFPQCSWTAWSTWFSEGFEMVGIGGSLILIFRKNWNDGSLLLKFGDWVHNNIIKGCCMHVCT